MGRKPNGDRIRKHVKRRTQAEAVAAVRALEAERGTGRFVRNDDDPALGQWLEHWLTAIVPVDRTLKTLATYRSQRTKHVIPVLGSTKLNRLNPEMLDMLCADMMSNGTSTYTTSAVHRVLSSALAEAARRRKIASNPANVARSVTVDEREIELLTLDETRAVIRAAATRRNGVRWSVALSLGLRQGEALGLQRSNLDLDRGVLRVRKALQ